MSRTKVTDDIVTRLRASCHTSAIRELPCTIVAPQGCPPCEAADEIERLRAEIDERTRFLAELVQLLLPFSMLMNKHEQEMLIKLIRSELVRDNRV